MIRRLVPALLLVVALAHPAHAQTVTDGRAWLTMTLQGHPGKDSPWRWTFDAILRSREGVSELDTRTFRPAVSYALSKHSSVGGGYAFVSTFSAAGGTTTEHRLYGVYVRTGAARGGTVTLRVRLEDRLIEHNSGALWRIRPQARFSHPVRPGSRLALVGWDELSIHLNTTTRSPRGVDQNRVFAGVATSWSARLRTEIGYLNQFLPGHGAAARMNHIVSGALAVTF